MKNMCVATDKFHLKRKIQSTNTLQSAVPALGVSFRPVTP